MCRRVHIEGGFKEGVLDWVCAQAVESNEEETRTACWVWGTFHSDHIYPLQWLCMTGNPTSILQMTKPGLQERLHKLTRSQDRYQVHNSNHYHPSTQMPAFSTTPVVLCIKQLFCEYRTFPITAQIFQAKQNFHTHCPHRRHSSKSRWSHLNSKSLSLSFSPSLLCIHPGEGY